MEATTKRQMKRRLKGIFRVANEREEKEKESREMNRGKMKSKLRCKLACETQSSKGVTQTIEPPDLKHGI